MSEKLRFSAFQMEMAAGWDEGIFVVFDADQETAKGWSNRQSDDGHHDDGEAEPEHKGVPLPLPELTGEGDGAGAGGMDQRPGREGHRRGVEDEVAEADEGNEEQKFEGIDEVVRQL